MGWLFSSMCFQNVYKFFYVIAFFSVKKFLYFYHYTKKEILYSQTLFHFLEYSILGMIITRFMVVIE